MFMELVCRAALFTPQDKLSQSVHAGVWPYDSYMQRRLGVNKKGELTFWTQLLARLFGRTLPNVPEHWL